MRNGCTYLCKHNIELEGMKAELDFARYENKILRHRVAEQEEFTLEQERIIANIVGRFKTDNKEMRHSFEKRITFLQSRIMRLETQLEEAERKVSVNESDLAGEGVLKPILEKVVCELKK